MDGKITDITKFPGLAKRHFTEATLLGLYNDPENVTLEEAKQTFSMLTSHRPEILNYEGLAGSGDFVTATPGSSIALANADFSSVLQSSGAGQ